MEFVERRCARLRALVLAGVLGALCGCVSPPAASEAGHIDVLTFLELDGPGENVDDPCFWVDPADPAGALLLVTTKDSGLVEVFGLATGKLVAVIRGFGRPNNCAVEGNLLLTTDRDPSAKGAQPGKVKVHRLPALELVRTFGEDMREPHGIDVLTLPGGQRHVYVTDKPDASVHVYELESGRLVRVFSTGFGDGIEPILADDRYQRIFVARGEKEERRGIGLFSPTGELQREFGADVFEKDAEGMAIYACGDEGYLVVADQHKKKTEFEVFDRRTLGHITTFRVHDGAGEFTGATDGIDILQVALPGLPSGALAACDGCGSNLPDEMDVVSWERVADAAGLRRCPGARSPD
jgi:3-phytase